MSTARTSSPCRVDAAPRLRLVEGPVPSTQLRVRRSRPHPAVAAVVTIVALVAIAVAFRAQQVAGQSHLDAVRAEHAEAGQAQQELRAAVAGAESPARVLEAALELGMIEPAPVVAVAAPALVGEVDPG